MKRAIYDGMEIEALTALENRNQTGRRGYIYKCVKCGKPARVHDDGGGRAHFEHKDRIEDCPLISP